MKGLDKVTADLKWSIPQDMKVKPYISSLILSVEKKSHHPLAEAITNNLKNNRIFPVEKFKDISGRGVKGIVKGHKIIIGTRSFMMKNKVMLCAELDKTAKDLRKLDPNSILHFCRPKECRLGGYCRLYPKKTPKKQLKS